MHIDENLLYPTSLHKAIALQEASFEELALELFRYQARYNLLYAEFLSYLSCSPKAIQDYRQIPCMPISCFREHLIQTGTWKPKIVFESSGTTGQKQSKHALRNEAWYKAIADLSWQDTYKSKPSIYSFFALLPSYLERKNSSLVYMLQGFIESNSQGSGDFYLYNTKELWQALEKTKEKGEKLVLWGVSYALLDFAAAYPHALPQDTIIIETGGMKGRRKELTKEALHGILQKAWQVPQIQSEYGMTELFSQSYSLGQGLFRDAPTLRLLLRDAYDPLSPATGNSGTINAIDLGNIDTCAFIATDDLGRKKDEVGLELLGRMNGAELRGCNLLIED